MCSPIKTRHKFNLNSASENSVSDYCVFIDFPQISTKIAKMAQASIFGPFDDEKLSENRRAVADTLAVSLHLMSFDLVKMVLRYLWHPAPLADATPKLLLKFGSEGPGGVFPSSVYGVACSPDNKIYTSCLDHVRVFSSEGQFLHHVAQGKWNDACGIAFDDAGNSYITDYSQHAVVVCSPDGTTVIRRIGSLGSGPGQFKNPWYIALDRKHSELYVVDEHSRCQVLSLDGQFIRSFGKHGKEDAEFDWPRGIAVNSKHEIAIADWHNDRIEVCHYVLRSAWFTLVVSDIRS